LGLRRHVLANRLGFPCAGSDVRVLLVHVPGRRASSAAAAAAVVILHRHGALLVLRVADLGLDVRPVPDVLVEVADVAADFLRWALATFTRWFHGFVRSFARSSVLTAS